MEIFETDYSDKEIELFTFFGIADLVNYSMPVCLYRLCVEKAFMEELTGPYVSALRRCYKALIGHTCFRGTPEWDNLIQKEDYLVCLLCDGFRIDLDGRLKMCKDCEYNTAIFCIESQTK
jgi:hypothetical protein